jgi:hypothetical protein
MRFPSSPRLNLPLTGETELALGGRVQHDFSSKKRLQFELESNRGHSVLAGDLESSSATLDASSNTKAHGI